MRWVFDLDGTLIDNRRAITEAYRAVGVPDVPWSISWKDFATRAQHDRKAEVYPEMLRRYATVTPLYELLRWSRKTPWPTRRVQVLTGASFQAVEAIVATVAPDLLRVATVLTGQTPHDKANWLARHGWGTYVDDDEDARRVIQELTTWRVIDPLQAIFRVPPEASRR